MAKWLATSGPDSEDVPVDIIRPTALPHAARLAASGLLLTALVVPSAPLAT